MSLTFFLLIGRYVDQRTRSVARSAAKKLRVDDTIWVPQVRGCWLTGNCWKPSR